MIRFLYNLIFPLVFLCMLPGYLARMHSRGKYRHKFGQRFGIYSERVRRRLRDSPRIWVHAVSVGEVLIALRLIQAMRDKDPGLLFVLSTTTTTGFSLANRSRDEGIEVIYHPLDFLLPVLTALSLIKPAQLVLIEAEVWPNLTAEALRRGATVALVNARLSPRSEGRYRRFRAITAPFFNRLTAIAVPDPTDVPRWESLDIDRDILRVTGSIKYDDASTFGRSHADLRPVLRSIGVPDTARIIVAGSTHAGEEILLARAVRLVQERHPDVFLVLVPRHAERARSICDQLERSDFKVARRTDRFFRGPRPDVLLVDTTGELRDWYALATLAFIGKSLTATGGQNPAEALTVGVPVLFGPHMENFKTLVDALLANGGATQIAKESELQSAIETLLNSRDESQRRAAAGAEVVLRHRGAAARVADLLKELRVDAAGGVDPAIDTRRSAPTPQKEPQPAVENENSASKLRTLRPASTLTRSQEARTVLAIQPRKRLRADEDRDSSGESDSPSAESGNKVTQPTGKLRPRKINAPRNGKA